MLRAIVGVWFLSSCILLSLSVAQDLPPLPPERYLWRYYDLPTADGGTHVLFLEDINSAGSVTAWSATDASTMVIDADGTVRPITCAGGAIATIASLNNRGQVVGTCVTAGHTEGVLWERQQGTYTITQTFSVPGAVGTEAIGINDFRQVVGTSTDAQGGGPYSFFSANGQYMPIGAFGWVAQSLTNWGGIVGYLFEPHPNGPSRRRGFFWYWGQSLLVDVPLAQTTLLWDMNDRGEIVGFYQDATFGSHSFLRNADGYREIIAPAPDVLFVDVAAVSTTGALAGRVLLEDPTDSTARLSRGFVATPLPAGFPPAATTVSGIEDRLSPRQGRPPVIASLETCAPTTPMKLWGPLGCRP
jgi:hypothetical protein